SLLLAPIRRVLLLPASVLQFSIEFENIIALFFPIEKIFSRAFSCRARLETAAWMLSLIRCG
ncbi:MAG: hypothetical protein ACLR09_05300, partial [Gallintestinimicrobium sp.]